ncbi:MAG: flagellin FliC [Candidatus Hydrogenedentes bacterium]|nr:flagellin FliC [Candidatus Hydrogenedentota bacterium]
MGLRINTNVSALNAQRQTRKTTNTLLKGFQQLASGLRINRAADDASGLAISERFRAEVRQLNAEASNLQYGVSFAQTADGALSAQQEGLQRVRELAVQAANGTLTDDQRAALNEEAQQIMAQIDATAQNTEFNGTNPLDGSQTNIPLGTEGGIEININESTTASLGLGGVDLTTQGGAANALGQVDNALNAVDQNRASLGAQQNRFERAISQREIAAQNSAEAESMIRDLDMAQGVMRQTQNQVRLQAGMAALAQANLQGENAARLLGS